MPRKNTIRSYGARKPAGSPGSAQNDSAVRFGSVLQDYRIKSRLSQSRLAELMQTSRNTITNWETGKSRPDADAVSRLCRLLDIPPGELFGLEGNSLLSPAESAFLAQYRRLSPVSRNIIQRLAGAMLQEESEARESSLRGAYRILPLHSTPAAAGSGCDFNTLPPSPVFIRRSLHTEKADALVRISGASMEPLYHDGDTVCIVYTQAAEDGTDVVCSTADGAVIKRISGGRLFSLNRALPFGEKTEDDHVTILGKVIGIVRADDTPSPEDLPVLEELMSHELREFDRKYGID